MPQIELIRPLRLSPTGGNELTVVNRGSNNVFYGRTSSVSATENVGTLAAAESLTLKSGFVWVRAEKTPVILDLREQPLVSSSGSTTEPGFNVLNYGAKGDGRRVIGVTSASASSEVTVPSASFVLADVGKTALVYNETEAGTIRTIEEVQSATKIKLSGAAGLTLNGEAVAEHITAIAYGTDDSTAIESCLSAAKPEGTNVTIGFNQPMGLGQTLVTIPVLSGSGFYVCTKQVPVPAGVLVDGFGIIGNLLASRTEPVLKFKPYSSYRRLYVECLFGAGIELGQAEEQADIHGGDLVLWHVGKEEIASVPQRGVYLHGTGYVLESIWMKGGYIGIHHLKGSDCNINRAFIIGAKEGVNVNKANQLRYGSIVLDSCGFASGTFYGVNASNESEYCTFDSIQAFQVNGSSRVLTAVLGVGVTETAKNNFAIRANILAQRTGAAVVKLEKAQDVVITFEGSNAEGNSAKTTKPLLTGVEYGTVAGNCMITGAMTGSLTPYTGTVSGTFNYTRTSNRYSVTGVSAPTLAAGTANGETAPLPTASVANGNRGTVKFGSGGATGLAAGEQVTVTYNDTTGYVAAPVVTVTPLNALTAELGLYIAETAPTKFAVASAKAPSASKPVGTYEFSYAVVG